MDAVKFNAPKAKHRRRDELPIWRPCDYSPAAEAAQALPPMERGLFVRVASTIANDEGDTIDPVVLGYFEKRALLVTLKLGGATIPTLTDLGVDVALWLGDDFERERLAEQFSQLIPRRRREALIAGPCPACGEPLIMTRLFLCSKCERRAGPVFVTAAHKANPHPWGGPDKGWRELDAPPEPRPRPSRHQRTAELAAIIAARLGLGA